MTLTGEQRRKKRRRGGERKRMSERESGSLALSAVSLAQFQPVWTWGKGQAEEMRVPPLQRASFRQ